MARIWTGPTVPLVLAWALKAVSDGMKQRLGGKRNGNIVGAQTMGRLSLAGSVLCAAFGFGGYYFADPNGEWSQNWGA